MDDTQIATKPFRILYPHLVTPGGKMDKFGVSMLIPKSDEETIVKFKRVINQLIVHRWGNKPPYELTIPLLDGDSTKFQSGAMGAIYENHYVLRLGSDGKVRVVDKYLKDIEDERLILKIKSGDFCSACVSLFAYDKMKNGVACWIDALQFVKFGERIETAEKTPIETLLQILPDGDELFSDLADDICS